MQDKKGVVVPCYNEAERLDLKSFAGVLYQNPDYRLCFVNDGSSDNTGKVLSKFASAHPTQVVLLNNATNIGKGESVRRGLDYLLDTKAFQSIGFLDADLSTSLNEFAKLNTLLRSGPYSAVFGSRIKRVGANIERSGKRHILGRLFATLISRTIQLPFYDTQCGAKVFKPHFLKGILNKPFMTKWLFDVEIIMRHIEIHGLDKTRSDILECPLERWMEVGGSKIGFADFYKIPLDLIKINRYFRE